jgi:hypothetical protein
MHKGVDVGFIDRTEERSDEPGESGGTGDFVSSDDADRGRIPGTTTVSQGGRISLVTVVGEAYEDRGVEVEGGDLVVSRFYDGRVVDRHIPYHFRKYSRNS